MKTETSARLCVWPHRAVPGFDGPDDKDRASKFPLMTWQEALLGKHKTDAHAVCYTIPGEDHQPRMNLPSHQWLIEQDCEPLVHWLFIDVDNDGHKDWPNQQAKQDKMDELASNPLLEDAGIYTTRGGYRLVWRLDKPVAARHWKHFYNQYRKHLRDAGIPADPATTLASWATCTRLPYVNRDGLESTPVTDFTPIEDGYTLDWTPPVRLRVDVGRPSAAIDNTQRAVVEPTTEEWRNLMGASHASQYLFKLQNGKPLARSGSRDTTLLEVIGSIGGFLKADDPNQIYRYIHKAVAADTTEGAPDLGNAWSKCCTVAQREAGKAKDKEAKRRSRKSQPAVLVHQDRHFYVLDTRADDWIYHAFPVGSNMLVNALESYTHTGIPSIVTRSQNGSPAAVRTLVSDHGSPVAEVTYVMGQSGASFDSGDGGTLFLGCCAVKDLEEVEDERVAQWLYHLAGDKLDVLLDWLATLLLLELPTCAIYLKGRPATGKSMLIAGTASVWGTKATPLQEMMSPFNAGLLHCPVVAADEGVTLTPGSMSPDIVFRNLVANSDHSINRKNMPVVRVRGCARVIIAANNDKALQFDNSLTEEDLQAIVSRTLYIEAQAEAAGYLQSIGGRNATHDWVMDGNKPGRIAKHIKWLSKNRQVKHGNRLLVEGKLEDWHRRFIVSVGINSQLLYIIAKELARNGNSKTTCYREGERVFVTTDLMCDKWDIYFPTAKRPSPRPVANGLRNLSVDKVRQGKNRMTFWVIPWTSVAAEAENLGLALNTEQNEAKNR